MSQIDDVRNKRSCPLIDYLCGQRNPRTECLQLPPELSQPQASFEDLPVSAIDSWELGVLIYHIYNFHSIRRPFDKQSLKDMNKLPQVRITFSLLNCWELGLMLLNSFNFCN